MKKFYQKLAMLFVSLLVAGTAFAANPVAFEIYESFDDATHYTAGANIPDGWKSEGNYPFTRNTGNYFGVKAKSGEYVFGAPASYDYGRNEIFYTPMMKLAAGKPCTVMFSVYAVGGTPANVRNNGFTVTAGNAQTQDAQTIAVGTVANAAYTSWTDFAFSFKPEVDGEYCFALKLNCGIASSGNVAIDEFTITGFSPAESPENQTPEVTVTPANAQLATVFVGETYKTKVNVKAANLVSDITVGNLSTSEITPAVTTIAKADAMSANGYDLELTVTPASATSNGGTFTLTTDNLDAVTCQVAWTAVQPTEVATLAALKAAGTDGTYKFTGEAVVTFVDASNHIVYMQDANDGVRMLVDNLGTLKAGDVVSAQYVGLQNLADGLTAIALNESLNVTASDRAVAAQEVTLAALAANAADYANELVVVKNVRITDLTEPLFSTAFVAINDGAEGQLAPFASTDLIGSNKTSSMFNLTGLAVGNAAAVVAPRAIADIQVLTAQLMVSPLSAQVANAFVGETYTTTIKVYGSNLLGDVVVKNISTEQLTTSVDTIPMADAMSEAGYALDVVLTPADLTTTAATFELASEGAESVVFQITWAASEPNAIESLAAFKTAEAGVAYKYVGEALVTYVDAKNGLVYMQDNTAGVRVSVANVAGVKEGDKVSGYYANAQNGENGLTVVALDEALTVVSSDNVVTPKQVTLKKLAANAAAYANMLVRVREVSMTGASFVAEGNAINDGAEGLVLPFEASSLVGTYALETFNLIGIALSETAAVVAPRSEYDVEEIWLEPSPENYSSAYELPYFNTFDNLDNDYDGTNVVPMGWKSVGSTPFITASINGVKAVTGTYYIVGVESEENERDDRLYTPMFRMTAGVEYVVSYYLYMPGNSGGGVLRDTDLRVTVGSEQDIDFQPITVQLIEDQSILSFTKQEFKFTPEYTGAYCFAFSLSTDVNYCGHVAIDDFNITAPGLVSHPTANFGIGGIFELFNSDMLSYPNTPVKITNQSLNAETYKWTVTCPDNSQLTSTDENPEFIFDQNGTYVIALDATNSRSTRSTSKSISVQYITGKYDSAITTWNPNHDAMYERGLLPSWGDSFIEDYNYDFVAGYNRFYTKMAERFELPDNLEVNVKTLNIWLAHYKNRAYTSGYDSEKPFSIVFYGETDGRLDENKVFGRLDSSLYALFGNSGIGGSAGEARDVNFVNYLGAPIKTKGTFYLAFEYADDMTVTTTDPNLGRSYMGMNTILHSDGVATLYAKPTKVPANSTIRPDGKWHRIDEIDPNMKGLGNYFILWVDSETSSIALNSMGNVVFAVRLEGSNLVVSGTTEGETVAVYNLNGQLVATEVAQAQSAVVDVAGLANGVYVAKTAAGVAKFVK